MANVTTKTVHPQYMLMKPTWDLMQDSYEGESCIKAKGFTYLPPTAGQIIDGAYDINAKVETNTGYAAYMAMKGRAVFPDFVAEGLSTTVGILNSKPPVVKVPKEMEPVLSRFTAEGENIQAALRKIHAGQLLKARIGLFVDMPQKLAANHQWPYVALYNAEDIPNWDSGETADKVDKLNLVVLEEDEKVRNGFQWQTNPRYRVLVLDSPVPNDDNGTNTSAVYRYALTENGSVMPDESEFKTAMLHGRSLNEIPFVFVGANDLSSTPDRPPMLPLARICHTIYKAEADYRTSLYMQGQETLVVIGGVTNNMAADNQESVRVGAGARIDVGIGGDAKYIGVSAAGLSEQRASLDSDRKHAAVLTGQLLQPGKSSLESGESLKTRMAAQTATLSQVAKTSCAALETVLKMIARWRGLDETQVSVTPNLDFVNATIQGQDIVQLQTAKNLGYPLSAETLHNIASERGLTKKTFDEEMEALRRDPEVLKKVAENQSGSLNGNNPVQSAGGGKKPPENNQTGKGNQPTE